MSITHVADPEARLRIDFRHEPSYARSMNQKFRPSSSKKADRGSSKIRAKGENAEVARALHKSISAKKAPASNASNRDYDEARWRLVAIRRIRSRIAVVTAFFALGALALVLFQMSRSGATIRVLDTHGGPLTALQAAIVATFVLLVILVSLLISLVIAEGRGLPDDHA